MMESGCFNLHDRLNNQGRNESSVEAEAAAVAVINTVFLVVLFAVIGGVGNIDSDDLVADSSLHSLVYLF